MAKDNSLSKRVKETIYQIMEQQGEMSLEEIIDFIRPHFNFEVESEREKAIRRKANQIMARKKDENGIRKYLNCNLNDESIYVNVENTDNVEALSYIEEQISKKIAGLSQTRKKVNKRRWEIEGQISLFDKAANS